jgi:hypothetical protein
MWFDTVSCQLFLWYNDGNSSQWVPAVAIPASVGEAPYDSNIYGRINGVWTNLLAAQQLNGDVGRNIIHNAMFNIGQRGIGPFNGAGNYTVDRWLVTFTLDTINIYQVALPDVARSQIGDEYATNALQAIFTGNAGATSFSLVQQNIEYVRRLAGKTVTVSFWANASATLNLGIGMVQNFGTGGSPSAAVPQNGQRVTVLSNWARYSVTFNLPSIAGLTIGTNNNDFTNVRFWFSAGANNTAQSGNPGVQSGTINLWGVQLEIGNKATPLEKIEAQDDLKHCQRFYQVGRNDWAGYGGASGAIGNTILFPVPMRIAPSIVLSNQAYAGSSGAATDTTTATSMRMVATCTATGACAFGANWAGSADL